MKLSRSRWFAFGLLFALGLPAQSADSNSYAGWEEQIRGLWHGRRDAPVPPINATNVVSQQSRLYARPVRHGDKEKHFMLWGINDLGDRVLMTHWGARNEGPLAPFGTTEMAVLKREGDSWKKGTLLRVDNMFKSLLFGVHGNELDVRGFSHDGRFVLYIWTRHDQLNEKTLRVMDVDTQAVHILKNVTVREDHPRDAVESDWYRKTFGERTFQDIFPDSRARCVSPGDFSLKIQEDHLAVQREGHTPFFLPLKGKGSSGRWDIDSGKRVMSKDCGRGMTVVDEWLKSYDRYAVVGKVHHQQPWLIEFGERP